MVVKKLPRPHQPNEAVNPKMLLVSKDFLSICQIEFGIYTRLQKFSNTSSDHINTLDSQLYRRGRGMPTIYKKIQSNGLSRETFKLYLDLLCNTGIT